MRYPVRTKIILFSLIPILSAYVVLFGLGLKELRGQARDDAGRWLQARASNHAYRLQLALDSLADATRALASRLSPEKTPPLQKAALLDQLASTRSADAAGVQWLAGGGWWARRGDPGLQTLPATLRLEQPQLARWQQLADTPSIRYQYPVRRNGRLIGSAFLQMSPQHLYRLLHEALHTGVESYLVDRQGRYLLHPQTQRIGQPLVSGAATPDNSALERSLANHSILLLPRWQEHDQPHLMAAQSIGGSNWLVALVADQRQLLQPTRQRIWWATVLLMISLAVVMSAIILTVGHTLHPLTLLTRAAEQVAAGSRTAALPPRGDDEIGRLSQALKSLLEQQQRQQREARSRYEELQARMQARTRELGELIDRDREQQQQLAEARDQAEAANRAKTEFLSNMSHELRTPLNGVLGYAQILRRDSQVTSRQRENLRAIESCGEHLLTLINDVLDLSRIEAGRMPLDLASVRLHQLIREVCDMIAQRAESKGLTLRAELADDLPKSIQSDATKLRQILLNLLGNAVKFTENGSVTLRAARDREHLRLEVQDTGVGIPDDQLKRIFDAFAQAEAGLTAGGTGLGLAISQHLIALLGGTPLQVDSTPGRGSRFHFSIPLIEAADSGGVADDERLDDADGLHLAPGQNWRLMVVDDSPDNRDILQHLLEQAGFQVESFADASTALARLRQGPVDLMLIDIRMPGMNGLQAAALIRDDPALCGSPLIAVSASTFPAFRQQVLNAGFDDFLGKPLRAGTLFRMLQKHLDLRYMQLDAVEPPVEATPPQALAKNLCAHIEQALEIGDMSLLTSLPASLHDLPTSLAERVATLARRFDFDALRQLCRQLQGDT